MKEYFRYVRDNSGNGVGAIAIVEGEHATFSVGVSVCSPNDTFDKSTAREIAFKRANEDPVGFSFYELVDNDWVVGLVDVLPHRGIDDLFCSTMFNMVDDIIMDYAKEHYKTLI